MTRAEFFGMILCHYPKCTKRNYHQCISDMSYWMSELTEEDNDIITPEKYKELYDKYIGSKIKEEKNE